MSEQIDPQYYSKRLPEQEANWGFSIQELDPLLRTHRSADEVLIDRPEAPRVAADIVNSGGINIIDPMSEPKPGTMSHYVEVGIYDYELKEAGLDDLAVAGKILNPASIEDPGILAKITDRERQNLFDRAVELVRGNLDTGYLNIPNELLSTVTDVSQVFEVENGRGGKFKVLNFSESALEGRNLQSIMNSFREMDDLTGGTSTETVSVVAIFPETLDVWKSVKEEAAEIGAKGTAAFANGTGVICLNESTIKTTETAAPEEDHSDEKLVVEPGDVGVTMFHELAHVMENELIRQGSVLPSEKFGWNLARTTSGYVDTSVKPEFKGDVENPTKYGATNHREDVAESAAAMYVGGDYADELDEMRMKAIVEMYKDRHSGNEGPAFLRCKEVNLMAIEPSAKIGTELKRPVTYRPKIEYRVKTVPVI